MSKGRIVFVTFELYPLTGGGIGRALYNIINSVSEQERHRITVIIVGDYAHVPKIPYKLKDLDIEFADINDEHGLVDGEAVFPPRWAFDNTEWHWRSYVALRALRELSDRTEIAYIEFTDWGGLGYCTTQEKRLGLSFSDVSIAVRLHGPHGVLLNTERYAVSENDISIFDIERKALRDCDIVIAQTKPYFEKVREVFGFERSEWNGRYFYSPLPVIVDSSPPTSWRSGHGVKRIIFTSKFQHIKRPEIFVRGVAEFLSSDCGAEWTGVFCAHIADEGSKQAVLNQIPDALRSRFEFESSIQGDEREDLIAHSIVVISSACESFCLAAFEASLLGAMVILNEKNPSFGEETLWQDGVNCLKFDGSASGLASALKRAASLREASSIVHLPPFERPWSKSNEASDPREVCSASSLISVVVYGMDNTSKIVRSMRNIAASNYIKAELIVALAGEASEQRKLLEEQITAAGDPMIKVVSNAADWSVGAILNQALRSCSSDLVVFVRAGDLIHSKFLDRLALAFEINPSIDCVGCHIGYFDPKSLPDIHRATSFVRYGIVIGEAALAGYTRNRSGEGPIAIRRTADNLHFDEELHDEAMWSFHRNLQLDQRRMMTFNATYAFCDITTAERALDQDVWPKILGHHDVLQKTSPRGLREGSSYLVMSFLNASLLRIKSELEDRHRSKGAARLHQEHEDLHMADPGERAALHDLLDRSVSRMSRKAKVGRLSFFGKRERDRPDYELLRKSSAFDVDWYLTQYPDVAESGVDPVKHYLEFGAWEGRFPNPYFDSGRYLSANPDVKEARINPLVHYVLHGRNEGRPLR